MIKDKLPDERLDIEFTVVDENTRKLTITKEDICLLPSVL